MSQSLSDKKNYHLLNIRLSIDYIDCSVSFFTSHFKAHNFDRTPTATNYLKGLLICPKGEANMERMEEYVSNSEYRAYQQFISNSSWDTAGLLCQIAEETSLLLNEEKKKNKKPVGYIIDESSHLKKGKKSVGVARQYAGVIGKVDNCQVGVYSSLVNHKFASIINERIFLPESWIRSPRRCNEAKIPDSERAYKTKPQLALDMIKQDLDRGVKFDWIGGDGLYGHNTELRGELDEIDQFYVLDVHKDEKVYLEKPTLEIPEKKPGRGKKPKLPKANKDRIRLDELLLTIPSKSWKKESIRDTVKGRLKILIYKKEVWLLNSKKGIKRETLIISKTLEEKPKIKFSFSNGETDEYTHQEYGYFVAQRYWVERTFDNAKNELGMSDYQTRKWKSWHNHNAIMMLASYIIVKQIIENQHSIPLLSFKDARILIVTKICFNQLEFDHKFKQMEKRHIKRQADIDFAFSKQKERETRDA